jgi:hypothetical protein
MPERLIGTRWKRDGRSNAAPEFESQFFRQFFLVCGAIGSAAASKAEGWKFDSSHASQSFSLCTQAVEGGSLQNSMRKRTSVQI